ncbi:hypothetical protein WA026_008199 [Henosepilachna vigintioctopunctata]|uniref:C2H2-type domain-containing protein n=1 Tax=Henosepilachna vigintioctopunctata TaxID=420089 RepID=A0AAW1TQL5_9CUCU
MNVEVEELNSLVNGESSSIKILEDMDTRKCVLDTKKNGSSSQSSSEQISDAFEMKDDFISNVKFSSDESTNNQKLDEKSISFSTIYPKDEPAGALSDLSISHVDEFSVDLKSIDVNSIRRSRTAKVRALENINTLENIYENEVVPQDAGYSENEASSKKKKSSKPAANVKHAKNDDLNTESEFIAPRRNRTAKAKALENICNNEKVANNNGDKEKQTNDVVKNLNNIIFPMPDSNEELLLSSHSEKGTSNSLKHINTHHNASNEFTDTSAVKDIDIQNVDNLNNQNIRIGAKESYNVEVVQSHMNETTLLNSSNNLITTDEDIDEVEPNLVVNIDDHNTKSESLNKEYQFLDNEKIDSIDEDNIHNNSTLSEARNQENRESFVEDIIPSRKNRLAKSKALENIFELKMKADNIDFGVDILEGKNDRLEKISKKSKNRKFDNSLSDENMSTEVLEGHREDVVYSQNVIFNNQNTKGSDKSEKITDCYDISKIDEDDNLNQNDLIFSPKKNKTIQSKVLQNKKNIHNYDVSTTLEDTFNAISADKSEQISIDVEPENDSLAQKLDCLDELTDSFQISSVLEATANEILKENQIEKRYKKTSVKKQNIKKSTKHVESSKLEECLMDTEGSFLNKSSKMESEIEGSLTENKSISNKKDILQPTTKRKLSEGFQEDEITSSEGENKRSRRACKVNTYNENELAEAIFMQAPVQKEKEKVKKKRLDSNYQQASTSIKVNEKKNSRASEKVMNSDELFDLLKATSVENPKSSEQTFSYTVDEIHNNLNDDNFNNVFDDILKKSQELFGEKSKNVGSNKSVDVSRSADTSDNVENLKNVAKKQKSSLKALDSYFEEEIKISGQATLSQHDTSKSDDSEDLFCDICKKSFKRIDNLVKHRTTLTHISKLSEIEAKQAEDKLKQIQQVTEDSTNIFIENDMPKPSQVGSLYSYSPSKGNDALKIAEIITNSFEKPSLHSGKNLSEMVPPVSEYRRYKSLGERKSFESDQGSSNISDNIDTNLYESHIPNSTGVILEKQITLLQNIIENRGLDYIDDMSISSYHSLENTNIRESPETAINSKVDSSRNFIFPRNAECIPYKKTELESFLKPPQVEDISEDSVNLKNSEDVKSRKVLNRDEELFLECCSLLKSGSEVSNFSKKSNRTVLNNIALKTSDEPDIFESKVIIDKMREESSDYSRIATPLGDSFGDASNSNTVLSNWSLNKEENIDVKEGNYFNFKGTKEESFHSSKFSNLGSNSLETTSKDTSKLVKIRKQPSPLRVEEEEVDPDSSSKMPTKGALKVFEGLKVSISTVELNLEGVLNNSPPIKKVDLNNPEKDICQKQFSSPKTPRSSRKSKPVKNKQQLDDRFIFKVKKKPTSKECEKAKLELSEEASDKIPDVYDFEETQDNTDVFVKPDFKTFRTKGVEELRNENIFENNYEGHTLSSSSSSTNSICKKPKTNECITKKKHMIMGRIFKNAVKPKADEDVRGIPNIDHNELVENYVLSCTPKLEEEFKKPKMTEEEMNSLFDKLLDKPVDPLKKQNIQNKLDLKTTGLKKKFKIKCKKRHRTNSDSTDDEFGLNRIVKKRPSRKNAKEEDNSINLEQELRECIGVASRKSQRKCTSGKQNVLVEYWSSDESAFETFLENHLQELSSRTDSLEQTKESCNAIEQKIEEENPIAKITNSKIHTTDKETKGKSKKFTASKKKSSSIESQNSAALPQPVAQINRRKRAAAHPLYHWSSSSEDETQDLIEVKSIRDDNDDEYDEDRPIQHGWIVGDSPKKLVTMLAQAKGKKTESESSVKEQGKKKNSNS